MKNRSYYVYIMASNSGTLYIGVTNSLPYRVYQHKNNLIDGFTKKYSCHKLLYFEDYNNVTDAISREKQLKKWRRSKKEFLIKKLNPLWEDLSQNI